MNSEDFFNRPLTHQESNDIITKLFGFEWKNGVLLDEEGEKYYYCQSRTSHDFLTLSGIFLFHKFKKMDEGKDEIRNQIKGVLQIDQSRN